MPYRFEPCASGEIYHIYNRSIAKQPVFRTSADYFRFYNLIDYYRFEDPPNCFSHYNRLSPAAKQIYRDRLKLKIQPLDLLAFAIMPTHFHLLLRQVKDGAIPEFISRIQEGYAKYLNIKTKRTGSVFQAMFKASRIETDNQLLQVFRYIHLNPLTKMILTKPEQLENYPWTSHMDYIGKRTDSFVFTDTINGYFSKEKSLREFIYDQIEYQRSLDIEKTALFHDMGE
jgi:putative transposase